MKMLVKMGLITTLAFVLLAPARAQSAPDMMPEATVVIRIAADPRGRAAWQASPLLRFYADPKTKGFFEPLRKQLEGLPRRVGAGGLSLGDLLERATGQVLLAGFPQPERPDRPLVWALLIETPRAAELATQLDAELGSAERTRVNTESARTGNGRPYTRVRVLKEEPAQIPQRGKKNRDPNLDLDSIGARQPLRQKETRFARYVDDRMLILAEEQGSPLERALNDGMRLAPAGLEQLVMRINVRALAPSIEQSLMKEYGNLQVGLIAQELRIGEIKSLNVTLGGGPAASELKLDVVVDGPREGIAGLLLQAAGRPEGAAHVPAATQLHFAQSMPLPATLEFATGLLSRALPLWFGLYQSQLAQLEQSAGINLQRDLFAYLGDEIGLFAIPDQDGSGSDSVWRIAVRNHSQVAAVLPRVLQYFAMSYGNYAVEQRGAGWRLREARLGEPNPNGRVLVNLALTDSALLGSGSERALQAGVAAEAGGKSLAQSAAYRSAMQGLAPGADGELYGASGAVFRAVALALGGGDKKPRWLDAGEFPGPSVFTRHFGPLRGERMIQGDQLTWRLRLPAGAQ